MVYKSKIGWVAPVVIFLIIAITSTISVMHGNWNGVSVNAFLVIFILYMLSNTDYTINDTWLHVRSGFMVNKTIDIASIRSIAETKSALSAPAFSLDRLEINYNLYDSVVVSPQNKADFVAALLAVNPQIEVKFAA
jgi:uncharacterized membrane protein YdbT with pleckstrin-like domain